MEERLKLNLELNIDGSFQPFSQEFVLTSGSLNTVDIVLNVPNSLLATESNTVTNVIEVGAIIKTNTGATRQSLRYRMTRYGETSNESSTTFIISFPAEFAMFRTTDKFQYASSATVGLIFNIKNIDTATETYLKITTSKVATVRLSASAFLQAPELTLDEIDLLRVLAKGDTGPQGPEGPAGVGISEIIFKETDVDGNNIYAITLTNAKTFDIIIPRGPQGPKGEIKPVQTLGSSKTDVISQDAVTREIKNLYAIIGEAVTFAVSEIEDKYTQRETAGGLNVIDGTFAKLKKVQGDTANYKNNLNSPYFKGVESTSRNLFNPESINNETYRSKVIYDADEDEIVISIPDNPEYFGYAPIDKTLGELCPKLKVGDTVVLSAEKRMDEGVYAPQGTIYLNKSKFGWHFNWVHSRTITQDDLDSSIIVYGANIRDGSAVGNVYLKLQIEYGTTPSEYVPYAKDIIELETAVALSKWDTILPEENKIIRQSKTIAFNTVEKIDSWYINQSYPDILLFDLPEAGSNIDAFIDNCGLLEGLWGENLAGGYDCIYTSFTHLNQFGITTLEEFKAYIRSNTLKFGYETLSATEETVNFDKTSYTAYSGGRETVIQGDKDNSKYGAENTLTQVYYTLIGESNNES